MAIGDARIKEFSNDLCVRFEAYADAHASVADNPDTGETEAVKERRRTVALALRQVVKAIKDVAGIDEQTP